MNTCEYCGKNPADAPYVVEADVCTSCKPIHDKMRKTHTKRAKEAGVPYIRFTPDEIFKRDDYLCHVCWKTCTSEWDFTKGSKNPDYATLGHIIPLKHVRDDHPGHVPTNVQTECMECNSRKGVRLTDVVHCCKSHRDTGVHGRRCHVLTQDNVEGA